jgi:predicted ATPase
MIAGVSRRVSSPYLVGRSDELAQLRAASDRAVVGEPTAVLLSGEAGVGKTRLIAELVGEAHHASVRVLVGGCMELGDDGLPYAPFVDAFRSLVRELDADPGALFVR